MEEINNQNEKDLQPEILFKKMEQIREIRNRQIKEEKDNIEKFGFEKEIAERVKKLPDDIADEILADARELKESGIKKERILEKAKKEAARSLLLYKDDREILDIYNKKYAVYSLKKSIDSVVRGGKIELKDFMKSAKINLDMNGLKALNDFGEHAAGDKGLKAMAEALKNGKTTEWLKSMGFNVTASVEGGDEFGIVISDDKNLIEKQGKSGDKKEKKLIDEITERYAEEIKNINASEFIDFNDQNVKERLEGAGLEVGDDFKYEISTSIGAAVFGEALFESGWDPNDSYEEIVDKISDWMLKIADERAIRNKVKFKNELKKSNPTLYKMYERPTEETKRLESENLELRKEIEELKAQLKYNETVNSLKNI